LHPQLGILLLELGDAVFQPIDRLLDILDEEHLRDVLRAVHVPGLEREHNDLLGTAKVAFDREPPHELGIVLDDARLSPQLDPPPAGVVHQEDECAGILREVARGDVLPVAAEIGKGECLGVEHVQEPLRPPRCWI